ncbi:hypothetical protein [Natrononativus amylolyticus]|uniref:hypothetical protein n=1 Tax=Natrononativus amylolyticus TaxID=2963434 RepID=UPI0020CEA0A8|nr:hypothetical protein [Natrononativus amylolyticus]
MFRHEGGDGWRKLAGVPESVMSWALCTDPSRSEHLWIGRRDGSILHSSDRGDNWTVLDGALPAVAYSMVMLPPAV